MVTKSLGFCWIYEQNLYTSTAVLKWRLSRVKSDASDEQSAGIPRDGELIILPWIYLRPARRIFHLLFASLRANLLFSLSLSHSLIFLFLSLSSCVHGCYKISVKCLTLESREPNRHLIYASQDRCGIYRPKHFSRLLPISAAVQLPAFCAYGFRACIYTNLIPVDLLVEFMGVYMPIELPKQEYAKTFLKIHPNI